MNPLSRRTASLLAATLLLCVVPSTARASQTSAVDPTQAENSQSESLIAPVKQPRLQRSYLQPSSDYSAGHRGVDYAVSLNESVLAATSGSVWFAGKVVNREIVTIRSGSGHLIEVEPVCPSVAIGQAVLAGQSIGKVCDADQSYRQHCEALRCLHFSYRTPNGYLSPIWVMGKLAPSRLLPWTEI